jgi:hypothetical protein
MDKMENEDYQWLILRQQQKFQNKHLQF